MEVVASLSQGRTAAAQCGLFTHKSVPVIFEPPCSSSCCAVAFIVFKGQGREDLADDPKSKRPSTP